MTQPEFPPPNVEQRGSDIQPEPTPAPPNDPSGGGAVRMARPPKPRGPFKHGFGLGAGLGLGLGLAGLVLTMALAVAGIITSLAFVSSGPATATTQLTTLWGSGSERIRAINVTGAILADASDGALLASGTFGYEIAAQLDDLTADDASAVVLLVNTPGGSIAGSRAIADAVVRYQERTGNKVLVHISSMSASGGVYATATADEIIADHGAMVGSVGVIFGPFTQYEGVIGTTGNILESGVTTTGGITSEYLSQGEGKDFGNPYRPITDDERAHYLEGLGNEYDNFVGFVAEHREIPESTITDEMGAHLFDPARAEEVGLIDGVLGRDEFFRHAAAEAGLDPADTRIEAIRPPSGWEALLGASRAYGAAPAVEQGPGILPALNPAFCNSTQPLAFTGDLASVCG